MSTLLLWDWKGVHSLRLLPGSWICSAMTWGTFGKVQSLHWSSGLRGSFPLWLPLCSWQWVRSTVPNWPMLSWHTAHQYFPSWVDHAGDSLFLRAVQLNLTGWTWPTVCSHRCWRGWRCWWVTLLPLLSQWSSWDLGSLCIMICLCCPRTPAGSKPCVLSWPQWHFSPFLELSLSVDYTQKRSSWNKWYTNISLTVNVLWFCATFAVCFLYSWIWSIMVSHALSPLHVLLNW